MGRITHDDVHAVHRRMAALMGPFDGVHYCPNDLADECACRKPRSGLVEAAAPDLGVEPHECVVIGDRRSDLQAGMAVGTRGLLVPSDVTSEDDIAGAPVVAASLLEAVCQLTGMIRVGRGGP